MLPPASAAPPQTAGEVEAKLGDVAQRQGGLKARLDRDNRLVDQLTGEVGALRAREAAAQAKLQEGQAQLDEATAAADREQKQLELLRARLARALRILEKQLVQAYKSDDPDTLSIILESSDWSDLTSRVEYLRMIKDHQTSVVDRVKALREASQLALERLNKAQARLETVRNELAAQEREVATARAGVEARRGQLVAARASLEKEMASLNKLASHLQGDLAEMAPGEPVKVTSFATTPGAHATLGADGLASAPASAPPAIKSVIAAANKVARTPYLWGGGHGSFSASGYDCSGSVSYALRGGGLISSPMVSGSFETYGLRGPGRWISIYANGGHMYAIIAGLRFDTSGASPSRWQKDTFARSGFFLRHPRGY